ncbi:glycosyltransferase family 2 protein [Candidatus Gottesmanbacteria bacterium]|nr:glycosyltransferase family 2 protein [Candidatus Gottesmanbacteria bacterium]
MKSISLAMAIHNEEENLTRALDSVKSLVEEIVIADGASTDRSVDIAKKYKAKILHADNRKMFHINKQIAIDHCTKKWILQLDADEVVSKELRQEIQSLPEEGNFAGYWMSRRNYFLGKFLQKGGQYPDYTLRLYRNGSGKLPCKSVHEQAVVSGDTSYLKNSLYHYPYPNFSHYLSHFDRYTSILAQELSERKVDTGIREIISYCVIKPIVWFVKTYVRHKGFMDGFAGFLFSIFSSLRFPVAFVKYWENKVSIKDLKT